MPLLACLQMLSKKAASYCEEGAVRGRSEGVRERWEAWATGMLMSAGAERTLHLSLIGDLNDARLSCRAATAVSRSLGV